MLGTNGESLSLVSLDDVNDINISNGLMDVSWGSLVDILRNHNIRNNKEGACFIPAQFKSPDDWVLSDNDEKPSYRNDLNVESISVVVLDLDEPGSKEKAEEIYKDFEHVIYSTHSYTVDKPYKFRIVLRLDEPISGSEWPDYFKSLIAPIDADRSCGNLSRVFYFPSHSPNAGLAPYFKHQDGNKISVNDINNIRSKYESGLSPEALAEFREKNTPSIPKSNVRTHFTGEKRNIHDAKSMTIDYSYEGMKESFAKFIPILSDNDNRHDFALKVCGSAVGKWGAKADFFNVVQFIYKASTEYGSKPLTDPSGDTRKEIPEIISSAVNKYAPEIVYGDEPIYTNLRAHIKEIVAKVEVIAITEDWDFPNEITSFSDKDEIARKLDIRLNNNVDYSRNVIRGRNIDSIKEFIKTGKLIPFVKSVYDKEHEINGDKMNINSVGQFVFYCIHGHATQMLYDKNLYKTLEVAKDLIVNNLDNVIPKEMNTPQNKSFFLSSIKIGHAKAKTNNFRWGICHNPSVEKPSPAQVRDMNRKNQKEDHAEIAPVQNNYETSPSM
ncbi:hypothetical protein [Psychromonas sp. SP041]|uniref:hypothetical protein n=1 Tax=Psychromonas sp. SP041 TaxID=1365007 RepID=UPI0010C773DB|nr:hypothetical protein [Psychromonas sp. SP041]